MIRGVAGVVLAVAVAAAPAPGQEGGKAVVVTPYDGKFAAAEGVQAALGSLPADARAALQHVCTRLGITRTTIDDGKITLVVSDAVSGTEARFPELAQAAAFTAFRPGARADSATIVCFSEWLARPTPSHAPQWIGILRHELVHAVLGQVLRQDTVLPAWVEEGLAVWVSGDGPAFVRRTALLRAMRRDLQSVCDGLESRVEETHRGYDYAEDYLAFVYMEQTGGEGAVQQFVDELIAGRDFAAAIKAACGRSWAAFHAGARMHATAALTGADDPGLKSAIAVLRSAKARQDGRTLKLVTEFLAEHPTHPAMGAVLFARAAALTNRRKFAPALAAFTLAYEKGSLFDDGCVYYMATLHGALGKKELQIDWFRKLARLYPESPRLPAAMYDLGFALHNTGKKAEARSLLAKCIASWPQPQNPRRLKDAQRVLAGK